MLFPNLWNLLLLPVVFLAAQDASTSNVATTEPAQQQQRVAFGAINIPVRVSGQSFNVRFSPELQSSGDMATRLCQEKAADIGVNEENFGSCVNQVTTYIQSYVDDWVSEKTLRFPFKIDERTFDVQFIPEKDTSTSMALRLCSEYARMTDGAQVTEANCVAPVENYISQRIDAFYQEKTLQVPLTVNDNTSFNIRFLPERQTPMDVATKLCVENAEQFKLTEANYVDTCVAPISTYLTNAVNAWIESKTLEITVEVNDKPYTISFMPERTTPATVSRQFCAQNGDELQLNESNVVARCVSPITDYIQGAIANWIEGKKLTVPISINDQELRIVFFPEREGVADVTRNFCLNQVTALSLTEENFQSQCYTPVRDLLRRYLSAWVEEKRAQRQRAATAAAAAQPATEQPAN